MNYCLITFRSVTPAQRGEQHLRRSGFICNLHRTPRFLQEQGCGYCIRVKFADIESAIQLFRDSRIPFRKVYILRETGAVEELSV